MEIAQDKVIAIALDPAALENHFGNTPIYGIVASSEMIEQTMMRYSDMGGTMNMNDMMQYQQIIEAHRERGANTSQTPRILSICKAILLSFFIILKFSIYELLSEAICMKF